MNKMSLISAEIGLCQQELRSLCSSLGKIEETDTIFRYCSELWASNGYLELVMRDASKPMRLYRVCSGASGELALISHHYVFIDCRVRNSVKIHLLVDNTEGRFQIGSDVNSTLKCLDTINSSQLYFRDVSVIDDEIRSPLFALYTAFRKDVRFYRI